MQMRAFRVCKYRPILDSEWIDVSDITVLVGKNESGKTALLKALHKFNPFKPDPYVLEREWPRGHRKSRSSDALVVEVRFALESSEQSEIVDLWPDAKPPDEVIIGRTYAGKLTFDFLPMKFPHDLSSEWLISVLQTAYQVQNPAVSDEFRSVAGGFQESAIQTIRNSGVNTFVAQANDHVSCIDSIQECNSEEDKIEASRIKTALAQIVTRLSLRDIRTKIEDRVKGWIPTFIYMDEQRYFSGVAHLDEIKHRKDKNQLTDEDKTFLMILELDGLDFGQECERAGTKDKEQRMLDMNDASLELTRLIADHWSQRKYQVRFEADGNHVIMFVSDEQQFALVPLYERSKGFQWFFSFDMTFLYETQGTFKGTVILLDEPGLHLHAAAQRDLLQRLKAYAQGNQMIYTTHMPFMIDMERLDNIRVCMEAKAEGTKVSSDFYTADEHARFPLQAALGLSMSQSLFVGPFNLVVEGITDFWLMSTIAAMLRDEGVASLDERVVITPSGGATKAAYIATMLQGQQLNVVVLLDSDPEGERVAKSLIKQWILKDRHVVMVGAAVGMTGEAAIEDLFMPSLYLGFVNQAYGKELSGNPLTESELNAQKHPQIIYKVDECLKSRGLPVNKDGMAFNKGRAAKLMMRDLPKGNLSSVPPDTIQRFQTLFQAINKAMPGLSS